MRDLIRSCKLRLQRKPSSITDSDAESQPLASSISSTASFGTLHDDGCMFANDSDASDEEGDAEAERPRGMSSALQRGKSAANASKAEICVNNSTVERIYNRLPYFTSAADKPNAGVLQLVEDSLIVIPPKFMTLKDFKDVDEEDATSKQAHGDKDGPTQNSLVTIFAIWNTIMGSSLLAISWGLEKAGLIPGIVVILLVAAICLYTAYIILQVNEKYGIYRNNEVPDLCRLLLGRWAEVTAKVFSLIVLIGANIVYWILMSNFLYNSVIFVYDYTTGKEEEVTSPSTYGLLCPKGRNTSSPVEGKVAPARLFDVYWNLNSTVPIFLSILMFPLLNFKSPTFFTKFNSLGTISVAYLFLMAIVKGSTWGYHVPDWNTEWQIRSNFSTLSGMLSLSFFIHNIIISICKNNRRQENNGRDLSVAFGLVTITYLTLGVVFYVCFPLAKSCLEDNILNNFPKYDTMAVLARMLLLFQLFTVFPLISYMLRINIFHNITALCGNRKLSEITHVPVIVLNISLLLVCSLFACFLPRIGTMIRYTGSISGMIYIFTLPILLKISALKRENALNVCNFMFNFLIILIGACNLGLQFFIQDS